MCSLGPIRPWYKMNRRCERIRLPAEKQNLENKNSEKQNVFQSSLLMASVINQTSLWSFEVTFAQVSLSEDMSAETELASCQVSGQWSQSGEPCQHV